MVRLFSHFLHQQHVALYIYKILQKNEKICEDRWDYSILKSNFSGGDQKNGGLELELACVGLL